MRPTNSSVNASSAQPSRRAPRPRARGESVEVDAGCDVRTLSRVGAVQLDEFAASSAVEAMSRSASATTCSSPITRALGSGSSPSASRAFLTLASVWAE